MVARHNERCKDCKVRVQELLLQIYGEVKPNCNLKIPAKPEDYIGSTFGKELETIHLVLQSHRGFGDFVRAKKNIAPVDFYVPEPGFIVEFDESQHFTAPRKIALSNYPDNLKLGFDRDRWQDLCDIENNHDGEPPYRDEQRAWYDLLRDFAPNLLGIKPTIRLYAKDCEWCSLDPKEFSDQEAFKQLLGMK